MKFPEHEKLEGVKEQSQFLGEFLEWLFNERNCGIFSFVKDPRYENDRAMGIEKRSVNEWLALFHNIDLKKLDQEKNEMLQLMRKGGVEG